MCLVGGQLVRSILHLSLKQQLICTIPRRRNGNMSQTCVLAGVTLVLELSNCGVDSRVERNMVLLSL